MDELEALNHLRTATSAETTPAVVDGELADILRACRLADADGRAPSDPDWEPRWDIGLARAKVYELKAARVAHEVTFAADGARFDLDARRRGYLDMADRERRRRVGSIRL